MHTPRAGCRRDVDILKSQNSNEEAIEVVWVLEFQPVLIHDRLDQYRRLEPDADTVRGQSLVVELGCKPNRSERRCPERLHLSAVGRTARTVPVREAEGLH